MNSLSLKQAQRCEDAAEPMCKCRCGGAFHGAKRGTVLMLCSSDPHTLMKPCRWCKGTGYWDTAKKLSCSNCGSLGMCLSKKHRVTPVPSDDTKVVEEVAP